MIQFFDKIKANTHTIAISKSDCHIFGLRKLNFKFFYALSNDGFVSRKRGECLDSLAAEFSVVSKKKILQIDRMFEIDIKFSLIFFIILIFFTAKDLIRGLLKTVPEERLSIEDVMRNKWVAVSHLIC